MSKAIPLAENARLFAHAGVGRTIRAAALLNLVDAFGIPLSHPHWMPIIQPLMVVAAVYTAALKIWTMQPQICSNLGCGFIRGL
jgi:hypothetical protein